MDGGGGSGGAEGELTAQETALYDRQIRVWGVDAQKRCAAAKDLAFALSCLFPAPASSVRFTNFCSIFLPSLFGARRRLLSLKVATFWVVCCILFISDVYHFFVFDYYN